MSRTSYKVSVLFIVFFIAIGYSAVFAADTLAKKNLSVNEHAVSVQEAAAQDQALKALIDRKNEPLTGSQPEVLPAAKAAPVPGPGAWYMVAVHVPGQTFGEGYYLQVGDNANYFDSMSVSKTMESMSSGYTPPVVLYTMNKQNLSIYVAKQGEAAKLILAGDAEWVAARQAMLTLMNEATARAVSAKDKKWFQFEADLVAHADKRTGRYYNIFSGNSMTPYFSDFEINRVGKQIRAVDRRPGKTTYTLDLKAKTITVNGATLISRSEKKAWNDALAAMIKTVQEARTASLSSADKKILNRLLIQLVALRR